jgi:hypothetical protein
MVFSAIGISMMMLTLLVSNPQFHKLLVFCVGNMSFFSIYVGSILICFHSGSSVCIILCILCRPLRCAVKACENLSVFIPIMMAKCKCSTNDSFKGEYPFIKSVNENGECTLCNAKFCIARGGQSDAINQMKTKNT